MTVQAPILAAPKPPAFTRAPEDDLTWMIQGCTPARRRAYLEAVGTRFGGDPPAIATWLLDRWSETSHGLRWTLDPGPMIDGPFDSVRGERVMAPCFQRTKNGINKLAMRECGGDLEWAITRAVDEMMEMYGFDAYMGT